MSERGAGTPQRARSGPWALLLWLLGSPAPVEAGEEVLALALDGPYLLLDAPQERRERVAQLDREAARARAGVEDCAASLGARRLADLQSALSAARLALGDADGALQAARTAARCAPRDATVQAQLATAALAALDLDTAAAAIARGRRLAPTHRSLQVLQLRLDFATGRWLEVIEGERRLDLPLDSSALAQARLLSASAQARLIGETGRAAAPTGRSAVPADAGAAVGCWPAPLLEHLLARRGEAALRDAIAAETDAVRRGQMLCEALFHLGQQRLARGETDAARKHFAAALRGKALGLPEYWLARLELTRLGRAAAPDVH